MDNNELVFGGNIVDGSWVGKWLQVTPPAIAGGGIHVVDLVANGYLPNDNYDYEIMISGWIWTNTTNGNNGSLWLYNSDKVDSNAIRISLCYARNRTASTCIQGTSCIFPLINNVKKICFQNTTNNLSSWGYQISGYRRLGTNE